MQRKSPSYEAVWDVFISHASEDKVEVARPLAEGLRRAGVAVWFDEFSLTVGDALLESIDRGIAASRYGIVVLSPSFFDKTWTRWELEGLSHRQFNERKKVLLPVWHEVTRNDVAQFSPSLANVVALSTADGLPVLVDRLLAIISLGFDTREAVSVVLARIRRLVQSSETEVAQAALLTAAQLGGPDAVDLLADALNSHDTYVAWVAARGLAQIATLAALDALRKAVSDRSLDRRVRMSAAEGLLENGDSESELACLVVLAAKDRLVRDRLLEIRTTDALAAVAGLVAQSELRLPDSFVTSLKPQEAATLRDCLVAVLDEDPNDRRRAAAADGLSRLKDDGAIARLIEALKDDSVRVRSSSAAGLAQFAVTTSTAALKRCVLNDEDWRVRLEAGRSLGRLGLADEDVTSVFELALRHSDPAVRRAVAVAARDLGGAANAILDSALDDTDYKTRACAIESAGHIGGLGVAIFSRAIATEHDRVLLEEVRRVAEYLKEHGSVDESQWRSPQSKHYGLWAETQTAFPVKIEELDAPRTPRRDLSGQAMEVAPEHEAQETFRAFSAGWMRADPQEDGTRLERRGGGLVVHQRPRLRSLQDLMRESAHMVKPLLRGGWHVFVEHARNRRERT